MRRFFTSTRGNTLLATTVLVACALCGWLPRGLAIGAEAPLDTLHTNISPVEEQDPRYARPEVEISRKELPDVQATVVPQAKPPSRPPRLKHPLAGDWHFEEARRAAAFGDGAAMRENLRMARSIEPDNPRYQWWQAEQALRRFDTPTLLQVVPEIGRTLLDSPVARGRLSVRLHQAALLGTTWFWTLLVAALCLVWWRHLAHDLGALIFKNRNHPLRAALPLILPLSFAALRPGWLGWLALMSIPLLIQTRGRQRALLAVTWVAAIGMTFPAWPALRLAPPTVDPDSEVTLLVEACRQDPSGPMSDRLRGTLEGAQDPDRKARLQVALGIQEARRGRFSSSDKLFGEVLKHDPDCFAAMIGLANNTYFRGRLDQALKRYQQCRQVHPARGEVGYNMAQVYFKKLFIPEATEALEQSRDLGFLVPTHMDQKTRQMAYSPVVYPGLSNEDLLAACAFEAVQYPPLITLATWENILGSPPVPLFLVLAVPLIIGVALILLWSRQNDPRECENCGVPLCRECCRVREGAWLCPNCGETASRSRSNHVLATLMKNRSRDEGMRSTSRVVRLGRLVPGAGHLASGSFAAGWARLALASLGFYLLTAGWIFDAGSRWLSPGLTLGEEVFDLRWLPLPATMWPGWEAVSILGGALLVVLSWVIGTLDGPFLRRGVPERLSWAPAGSEKPCPTSVAQEKTAQPAGIAVGPGLKR